MSCIYAEWLRKVARDLDSNAHSAVCYESARYIDEMTESNKKMQQQIAELKQTVKMYGDTQSRTQALIENVMSAAMVPGSVVCRLLDQKIDRIIEQAADLKRCIGVEIK